MKDPTDWDGLRNLFEEPAKDEDWQRRAACAEVGGDEWFPEKGGSTREAKRVCLTCEVRDDCLNYALTEGIKWGIWGGVSERQRRHMLPIVDADHQNRAA